MIAIEESEEVSHNVLLSDQRVLNYKRCAGSLQRCVECLHLKQCERANGCIDPCLPGWQAT
jgi:hypothetical protein